MLELKVTALVAVAVLVASACGGGEVSPSGQQAGSAASGGASTPVTPPAASPMPMDVPSGTELLLTLETPVSSQTAKIDQPVRANVSKPVIVAGMTVIPEGAPVTGTIVAAAERSGPVKGPRSMAVRFDEVTVLNTPYKISTAHIALETAAAKGEGKVGIDAGATLSTTIQETVRIMAPM